MTTPPVELRDHFDALHASREDPWGVLDSWYEVRKRRLLLASLPEEALGRVLEIGCSIGAVTESLAERAASVVAVDLSEEAVRRARTRLSARAAVDIRVHDVRNGLPDGEFDTIVVSEVGYYLTVQEWKDVLDDIDLALAPGGVVALCHWRTDEPDFLMAADLVHETAIERLSAAVVVRHDEADFRLDVLSRDARPVSRRGAVR